jgi:hypothetical protein
MTDKQKKDPLDELKRIADVSRAYALPQETCVLVASVIRLAYDLIDEILTDAGVDTAEAIPPEQMWELLGNRTLLLNDLMFSLALVPKDTCTPITPHGETIQ